MNENFLKYQGNIIYSKNRQFIKTNKKKNFDIEILDTDKKKLEDLNISFFIPIWGKEYINKFFKSTLLCFVKKENQKIIKSLNNNSKFCIWTKKIDKEYLDNLKEIKILRKIINIEYFYIDEIFSLYRYNTNKYEKLSILQNLFISYSYNQDYLIFIYPDFIFNQKSFSELLNRLTFRHSAIFCPVPQIIYEDVIEKIRENNLDNFLKNIEKNVFANLHDIVLRTIINKNQISSDSSIITYKQDGKFYLFNSFHIHPLAIKVQKDNPNFYKKFFPSFDESFVSLYANDNSYHIPGSSNEMIFASLAGKKDITILKANLDGDLDSLSDWAAILTNSAHRNFVKKSYILQIDNYSKDEIDRAFSSMENFIENLLDKISLKTPISTYKDKRIPLLDLNFHLINLKLRLNSYSSKNIKKLIKQFIEDSKVNYLIKSILKKIYL